ncbi:MAG: purine-nucleoside phosphorylase [Deltaproteobacteria bacterium]|nr:purine-nucleoside phosphorylase [Deltaproteobacteria bacterium]
MTAAARAAAVEAVADFLRRWRPGWTPRAGLVLGSGLGALAEEVQDAAAIPYGEIPGFPVSTVIGHAGRLVTGTLEGLPVAVLQGRVHLYEGLTPDQVVLPVRSLRRWGAGAFILTNASGSVRPEVPVGTLVILRDLLSFQGPSCLTGPNPEAWGPRFPDMTTAFDPEASRGLLSWGRGAGLPVDDGVYAAMPGPAYETPAEVGMAARLGCDVVGMSTAQEVLALRHMGARVLGISCVTNLAAGVGSAPLDHAEVAAAALAMSSRFAMLVREGLHRMA